MTICGIPFVKLCDESINSANRSKISPVFIWIANVVNITPVDVRTRQDISSLNTDPGFRPISANTILNMDLSPHSIHIKWHMKTRTGWNDSVFEGFDDHTL